MQVAAVEVMVVMLVMVAVVEVAVDMLHIRQVHLG
jgi:hypothetical protein